MTNGVSFHLAQQGHFQQFAMIYCCMLPLGFFAVLGLIYFTIRHFASRSEDANR